MIPLAATLAALAIISQPGGPRLGLTLEPSPTPPTRPAHFRPQHTATFVGVDLGTQSIDTALYARVTPKLDLVLLGGDFRMGLHLPLHLNLFDAMDAARSASMSGGFARLGALRTADYRNARDALRVLHHLELRTEHVEVHGGTDRRATVGEGHIVRGYNATQDLSDPRVGLDTEVHSEAIGLRFVLGDLGRPSTFALHGHLKPTDRLTFSATWATDRRAPLLLERNAAIGTADIGAVRLDADGTPLVQTRSADVLGATATFALMANSTSTLNASADVSTLLGGDTGLSLGLAALTRVGSGVLSGGVTMRTYGASYAPSYFDGAYAAGRLQYGVGPNASTKLGAIRARGGGRRVGAQLEGAVTIPGRVELDAALAIDSVGDDRFFMVRVGLPLSWLHVYGRYEQHAFQRLFTLGPSDVLSAGARLPITSFLAIHGRVDSKTSWNSAEFSGLGGMKAELGYRLEVELGYAFD